MALTDTQVWDLAERMNIPLVYCNFKNKLLNKKLQYNKFYILNLEDEHDENGEQNGGSHYTCFQVNKYPNGKTEGVYFDSFGIAPPEIVQKFTGLKLPYSTKDIQSLMNSACGWYCLAFGHWINSSIYRSKDLYTDCASFLDMFDDLAIEQSHLKNEWVLKHFFRSTDPSKRTPVELGGVLPADPSSISSENNPEKTTL
jgi:hypothetical protein